MPDQPGTGTGASDDGGQPPATPPTPPPAPPAGDGTTDATKTFTQEDVSAIAAREAAEAARRASRQFVTQLGFQNQDEAIQWVTKAREAEKAQMTEAERKLAEANELVAAASAREAQAATVILNLGKQKALIDAGVPARYAETLQELVKVEAGASAEDVTTAVASLKELMPHLFVATGNPPAPSSEPSNGGVPPKRTDSLSALDRGAAEAVRRGKGRTPPA